MTIIFTPGVTLKELEEEAVRLSMAHTNYNKTQAAKLLGITLRTMIKKCKQFEIEKPKTENEPVVKKSDLLAIPVEELIAARSYKGGMKQLSVKYNCHRQTIRDKCLKAGLMSRKYTPKQKASIL